MTTPAQHNDGTEVERLRALVLDQGDAVTTLTRKLAAMERLYGVLGETGADRDTPPVTPYDEAAAIQARRRAMHLAGGTEARQ